MHLFETAVQHAIGQKRQIYFLQDNRIYKFYNRLTP
jgi:hypothetical protein